MSKYEITVNGETYLVEVGDVTSSPVAVVVNGEAKVVTFRDVTDAATASVSVAPMRTPAKAEPAPAAPKATPAGAVSGFVVKSPMPGKILSVVVQVGSAVKQGQTVCTLEAMKMEMPIASTQAGTVKAIHIAVGANVAFDDPLVTLG